MKLIPLQTSNQYYPAFEALITDAFPPEERRPAEEQRQYTDHNSLFHPYAVIEKESFIGLLTCWMLDGFLYVEHLATLPTLRGSGRGQHILSLLAEQYPDFPTVLEVEPPTTNIARRRIDFYIRCGFTLWENQKYIQPAYAPHLPSIPLLLMVRGGLDEQNDFDKVCKEIHWKVYEK